MNERVKVLRKTLKLSGEKFGKSIGLAKSTISTIERGRALLTDRTIKFICSEYKVNEQWLRFGIGDMFLTDSDVFSLDDFISQHSVDEIEVEIIKIYLSLDKNIRKQAIEHFKSCLSRLDG